MPRRKPVRNSSPQCTLPRVAVAVFICVVIGSIGSLFTAPAIDTWYSGLEKPLWTPPNWAFAPVWTTLFVLMGVALCWVWGSNIKKPIVKTAVKLFAVQLVLNVLWSYFFFGLRSPLYGMIEIVVLWLAIAATIWAFHRVSKMAAYLLVPYIVWVTIAAMLNYSVLILNAV